MQILQIICFVLFIAVFPLIPGTALHIEAEGPYACASRWCLGWCVLYASFYWPAEICVLLKKSLTTLILIWGVLIVLIAVLSAIRIRKYRDRMNGQLFAFFRGITLPEVLASLAVIGHAAVTLIFMHIDNDDYMYVANATTTLDTNSLLVINGGIGRTLTRYSTEGFNRIAASPHFAFYAALSKLFGTRPAALCHTYLPPVFTCLFFIPVFMIGAELFNGDRRKTGLFAAFAFLIHISAYYSSYTAGSFIMIRSWQGKSQVVGMMIPLVLWFFLRMMKNGGAFRMEWMILFVILQASCLLTPMGAMLAAGETALLMCISALMLKDGHVIMRSLPALLPPLATAVIYLKLV